MFAISHEQTISVLRIALWICLFPLLAGLLLPDNAWSRGREEYTVKAAFVLNFAKGTQWPQDTSKDSPKTIDLCLSGEEQLVAAFSSIDGKQIGNRTLRLRHKSETEDCRECEILFISDSVPRSASLRILAVVKDSPVLIIGETPDFARIGGIINFISKKDKLHFEINPREAEQHGIKISSRILQLATIVESN